MVRTEQKPEWLRIENWRRSPASPSFPRVRRRFELLSRAFAGAENTSRSNTQGRPGAEGQGGVPNPNAKTAQQVPGLKYVAEGYTKDELRKRILDAQREIPVMDPRKTPPPLYMPPWRGKIAEGELVDLMEYLISLLPKGEKADF